MGNMPIMYRARNGPPTDSVVSSARNLNSSVQQDGQWVISTSPKTRKKGERPHFGPSDSTAGSRRSHDVAHPRAISRCNTSLHNHTGTHTHTYTQTHSATLSQQG